MHDRLELPVPLADKATLVVDRAVQALVALVVRFTVPAKFWVLVRVIADVRICPAEPVGDVTVIVKSPTWTVMVTE